MKKILHSRKVSPLKLLIIPLTGNNAKILGYLSKMVCAYLPSENGSWHNILKIYEYANIGFPAGQNLFEVITSHWFIPLSTGPGLCGIVNLSESHILCKNSNVQHFSSFEV